MSKKFGKAVFIWCLLTLGAAKALRAGVVTTSETKVVTGIDQTLTVKDEKFKSATFDWSNVEASTAYNSVSLRILDKKAFNKDFTCSVKLRIEYFKTEQQSVADVIENVQLNVDYKAAAGALQKLSDVYKFQGGYEVTVTVMEVSSPDFGPSILELSNSISVDYKYKFNREEAVLMTGTFLNQSNVQGQLKLNWQPILGAEEYDVEWALVDEGSEHQTTIAGMKSTTTTADPVAVDRLFRNNATRINTHTESYPISLVYNSAYLAVRIRGVHYNSEGIREEGNWGYYLNDGKTYAVWDIGWHQSGLNWQYSATFAEEGKKKEVINYFDGTLRGRQTATINSSDQVAIVQENVYDEYGRPLVSILPAPYKENSSATEFLHYFPDFNKNEAGQPYSFSDILKNCEIKPLKLGTTSGASRYYSPGNQFVSDLAFKRANTYDDYIPDAKGYPFSITQYTPDNTGRIRLQGGVGQAFQPGETNSKATKYFYSKPTQWELDRLFGNDAGFANHYLKNMVVDPNNQVSISYLNASGKTVATALAGKVPDSQVGLGSANQDAQTINLVRPEEFRFDATQLTLSAKTTYVATVPGKVELSYNLSKLIASYTEGNFTLCKDCYYDLRINVVNDCGTEIYSNNTKPIKIGDEANLVLSPLLDKIGEYYISFEFQLSKDGIEAYADQLIVDGQAAGGVKKEIDFIKSYLDKIKLANFGGCQRCIEALGSREDFTAMFKQKLTDLDVTENLDTWIGAKYDALIAECTSLQQSCPAVSPCTKYIAAMVEHVSPGGQYALFDKDGAVLEAAYNILYQHWKDEFPTPTGGQVIPESELVVLDDGTRISPYDDSFSTIDGSFNAKNIIEFWREEWAGRFLKYHPEYCKLQFCNDNANSIVWDYKVKEEVNEHAKTSILSSVNTVYSSANPLWLVQVDPFFKERATSDPLYKYQHSINALRILLEDDLNNYSKNILKLEQATAKSLPQFISYQLYCLPTAANQTVFDNAMWSNCSNVADDCRVWNREWQDYRDTYFELKEKYYQKFRNETYCGSQPCEIGTPPSIEDATKLMPRDFAITKMPATTDCPGQYKVSYRGSSLKKSVTVLIYYPDQTAALEVELTTQQPEKTFCVSPKLPSQTIKIIAVLQ